MAEVLPPIVQSTSTITMLHTPPDAFQPANPSQQSHSASRHTQVSRSHVFNGNNGGIPYRGISSTPAYAFQSTPNLRQEIKTSSTPTYRQQGGQVNVVGNRTGYPSSSSASSASSSSSSNPPQTGNYTLSKDDSVLAIPRHQFDMASSVLVASSSTPDLTQRSNDAPVKPSPDRYRRVQRRAESSPIVPTVQNPDAETATRHSLVIPPEQLTKQGAFFGGEAPVHRRAGSADDTVLGRPEATSRYRRRSVGAFEPATLGTSVILQAAPATASVSPTPAAPQLNAARSWAQVVSGSPVGQPTRPSNSLPRPNAVHQQQINIDTSTRPSSARQDSYKPQKPPQPNRPTSSPQQSPNRPESKTANSIARGTSEVGKRFTAPSPLSKPVTTEPDTPKESPKLQTPPSSKPSTPDGSSPAVQQLHAISESQPTKTVKSRLRRAFSFSSSQELRKASAENAAISAKLKKEKPEDEIGSEEAAIIAKQEAAGLGAGIYSNQGFAGSTDNISMASTASSASLMLRKMGQGLRKSTRSLKGLFRPKSVVGVPAADGPVSGLVSTAEVSLVTVEAETHKVNVNADPHEHTGGGTGYPRLERNSMESSIRTSTPEHPGSSHENKDTWGRRSIVGGDMERAEVLAAVRKGILKRK